MALTKLRSGGITDGCRASGSGVLATDSVDAKLDDLSSSAIAVTKTCQMGFLLFKIKQAYGTAYHSQFNI